MRHLRSIGITLAAAVLVAGCTTRVVVLSPTQTAAPSATPTLAVPSPVPATSVPPLVAPVRPAVQPVVAAPTLPPPPPPTPVPPTEVPGPRLTIPEALQIGQAFFVSLIEADPYHPPGTVACSADSFDSGSRLWSVGCDYASAGGYEPGFGPDDYLVRVGLAQPIPYPTGIYLARTVLVDDRTGIAQ